MNGKTSNSDYVKNNPTSKKDRDYDSLAGSLSSVSSLGSFGSQKQSQQQQMSMGVPATSMYQNQLQSVDVPSQNPQDGPSPHHYFQGPAGSGMPDTLFISADSDFEMGIEMEIYSSEKDYIDSSNQDKKNILCITNNFDLEIGKQVEVVSFDKEDAVEGLIDWTEEVVLNQERKGPSHRETVAQWLTRNVVGIRNDRLAESPVQNEPQSIPSTSTISATSSLSSGNLSNASVPKISQQEPAVESTNPRRKKFDRDTYDLRKHVLIRNQMRRLAHFYDSDEDDD